MTELATGSCLCGAIRFTYQGSIGPAAYCHCTDCIKCSGSAFSISIALETDHFKIIGKLPAYYTKQGDSGSELTLHFCPDCGSPMYTSSPKHKNHIYVKVGIIDDPALIRPAYQCWVLSAVPWSEIGKGLTS